MIAEVLKTYLLATLRAGDIFISNDPYRGGGHLPDIGMFRPVFYDGKCVAFTGCMIHHTDVGAVSGQ
jgi:N-methylhydantoinase B